MTYLAESERSGRKTSSVFEPARSRGSLEVLARRSVAERLVATGNPAATLHLHTGTGVVALPLFDIGIADTAIA